MFYLDEDERRHIHEESLYYASDVNVRFILDSYTDNETSFEFLTIFSKNSPTSKVGDELRHFHHLTIVT